MYRGMRWLKCNLHMHTPADKVNWREETMLMVKKRLLRGNLLKHVIANT